MTDSLYIRSHAVYPPLGGYREHIYISAPNSDMAGAVADIAGPFNTYAEASAELDAIRAEIRLAEDSDMPADIDRAAIIVSGISCYPGDSAEFDAEASWQGPSRIAHNYDRRLALALETLSGHGFEDDHAGDTDIGYGSRFGRFILWGDSHGFLTAETFKTESAAIEAMETVDKLYGETEAY